MLYTKGRREHWRETKSEKKTVERDERESLRESESSNPHHAYSLIVAVEIDGSIIASGGGNF